jgi:hypothetical protein
MQESQRMSIETFEATEREREKEVRRRASTKRPRASRPTGDSEVEEPEQRRHATHLFEEKLPAKKPTTTTMPLSSSSAVVTTAASTASAITTASSSSSYASSTTSLKSKGSTLKSLFPRTAIPLDDDDDSATDTTIEATPVKKQKNAKNAKKAARKSVKGKGKGKKRSSEDMLSSDLRDNEDESAQNDDKENAVNLKVASASASSASASGGSQIKKRKLFTATTANKESQLSSAGTSLASSTGTDRACRVVGHVCVSCGGVRVRVF